MTYLHAKLDVTPFNQLVERYLEISDGILYGYVTLLFRLQGVGFKQGGDMHAPYIEVVLCSLLFHVIIHLLKFCNFLWDVACFS